jgi:hypothetical protein
MIKNYNLIIFVVQAAGVDLIKLFRSKFIHSSCKLGYCTIRRFFICSLKKSSLQKRISKFTPNFFYEIDNPRVKHVFTKCNLRLWKLYDFGPRERDYLKLDYLITSVSHSNFIFSTKCCKSLSPEWLTSVLAVMAGTLGACAIKSLPILQ